MNTQTRASKYKWGDNILGTFARALKSTVQSLVPSQRKYASMADNGVRMSLVAEHDLLADWEWDVSNGLLHFNQQFVERAGAVINHGTVTSDWFLSRIHPQDKALFVRAVSDFLISGRRKLELVFRVYDSHQKCLTVQCRGAIASNKPKRLVGIFTFLQDVEDEQRKLSRYMQLEKLMAELSNQFLTTKQGDFESTMQSGLQTLISESHASRACLIHCQDMPIVYEWGEPIYSAMTQYMDGLSGQKMDDLCAMFSSPRPLFLPDTELDSQLQKELLEHMGATMMIAFPLSGSVAGKGCLLLGFEDIEEAWFEEDIKLLNSIADLFFILLDKETVRNELHSQQELLLENQQLAKLGSWVLTQDSHILQCTPEVYRIFGIDLSTDIDFNLFIQFVHPEDRAHTGEIIQQAIANHGSYDFVYRIITAQGELKYVQGRGQAIFDDKGMYLRRVGSVMDVTERKEAEDRTKLSAILFDSTQEGVMITDKDGRIIAVNQAFSEITGYSEQEALGEQPSFLKSGRHEACFYECMYECLNRDGEWQGEIWNKRKDGDLFPEWLSINVVKDKNDQVTHQIAVFSDLSQIKQSEEQLEHLSHHDPLTNLPNRLLFHSRLSHALDIAKRNSYKLAVLYIDLDHFKNINDSLGHGVGDELLIKTAQRLKHRVRESDTLARLGGDEFILLLEQVDSIEQVAHVAQSIIELLAEPFHLDNGQEVFIGASIGVSFFPTDGANATDMISHADAAVYQAKEAGRNNVHFYTAALTEAAQDRLALESELRRALTLDDELQLYYQPQVSMHTGEIVGAEALIRWHHPDEGIVSPMRFLPVAEKSGLMAALDFWVLETACRQHAKWQAKGLPAFILAINITKYSFMDPGFLRQINQIIAKTGIDPKTVELEITEGALIEPSPQVIQTIADLKHMGFTLAIDDFGTGYSSLAYLQRFNVDKLKIDRSFVKDVLTDTQGEAITSAIISMAKSLDLSILAEGVEDADQLALLKGKGCEVYQGFFFSKPIEAPEFAELLQGYKP